MEKPRGARLLHRLLVLYQRVAGYQLSIVCIFLRIRFKKSWQTLCLFMSEAHSADSAQAYADMICTFFMSGKFLGFFCAFLLSQLKFSRSRYARLVCLGGFFL